MSRSVTQILQDYPLTPSEIILLGEKALSAPLEFLVERMLAAAFIANEEVGAIRLEVRSRKWFFGRFTSRSLLVVPRGHEFEWPYPSLEAKVLRNLDQLSW